MAKKTTPLPPSVGEPQVRPEQGITLIDEQIALGETILSQSGIVSRSDYDHWWILTKDALELTFGKKSDEANRISGMQIPSRLLVGNSPYRPRFSAEHGLPRQTVITPTEEEIRTEILKKQVNGLFALREVLARKLRLQQEVALSVLPQQPQVRGNKIFLVHGHDSARKHEVADFLQRVTEQRPIILQEQANEGRTIIEKFEYEASDVGFAVVLLTADDKGGPKAAPIKKQSPRARQNVVFELGYFSHALGRNRVCALYEKGVELPSDYQGVLYIEIGKDNWLLNLASEIKAADIPIDMDKAI